MHLVKRSFACLAAAVTLFAGTAAMPAAAERREADGYRMDELSQEIAAIGNLQAAVRQDYTAQNAAANETPAVFHALFVKCADVTMQETDGSRQYLIPPGSDTDKVIDHGIRRFEETVEEMTAHALDIIPTVITVNDPLTVNGAFGYADIKDSISEPIPVSEYESVFFFSGREGIYSTTGPTVFDAYGESYIQTVCVKDEIARINRNASLEEERREPWTCGNITHEWIHQLDTASRSLLDDAHFPLCHDYQYDGKTDETKLIASEEDGIVYLTNPFNGYKWKYEAGKYPDFLGDYYEAFLSDAIIDTQDGGKKKGMFPALWKFICTNRQLGTYTIQNTATGHYLNAEPEADRFGASVLDTAADSDPFSANTQWSLFYDSTAKAGCSFRIYSEKNPTELIRAEQGASVDTAALYRTEWGTGETDVKCFAFTLPRDADGNYQIRTTLGVFKDFVLTETETGGIECCKAGGNDTWRLTRIDMNEGDYYFRNPQTGDALTMEHTAAAMQPFVTKDAAQTWTVRNCGKNLYVITSADGKTVLSPKDGKAAAGIPVLPVSGLQSESDAQLWQFRKDSDGFYTIVFNAAPSLCLTWDAEKKTLLLQNTDAAAAQCWDIGQIPVNPAVGTGICYLRTADGSYLGVRKAQIVKSEKPVLWTISEAKDGYFLLRTYTNTGRMLLHIKDTISQEGTAAALCAEKERTDNTDQWAFPANADGTFRLMPKTGFTRDIKLDSAGAILSATPDSFSAIPKTFTAEDVKALTAWLCGSGTLNNAEQYDLTNDGTINAVDLTLLKRFAVSKS